VTVSEQAEEVVIESRATPEQRVAAERMGWIPETRYKGKPEDFVDAPEYLRRGEEVLPIVKKQNERLHQELAGVRNENASIRQALAQATAAIEDLKEIHSVETQKAVEQARRDIKAQLAEASREGDHQGVAELTDQLTKLNDAKAEAKETPVVTPPPPPMRVRPDVLEWNRDNPWFGQDKPRTALLLGCCEELRAEGSTLSGREFFEAAAERANRLLAPPKQEIDKVEGARNSGEEGSSIPRGQSFAALPKEARDECDKQAADFVGKGKRYPTKEAWRNRYAQLYFNT